MSKPKKTTEPGVSAPAAENQRKRATATPAVAADAPAQPEIAAPRRAPARRSAASHKHSHKAIQPEPPVHVQHARPVAHDDIARLAYSYWEARGHQGGSPEEDWLRAERELLVAPQNR